ncbi:MAG: adenylate/guanylate cyclase domain-containing protein [Selenomonadaceae bacterium]|nr:adenylate/guanylate cyclase domain-containing protein [Selenomonadaceae bacterium]
MKTNTRNRLLRSLDAFLIATLITTIAACGWLDDLDYRIADRFYQQPEPRDPNIIVIGIDKITLSKLGPEAAIPRGYFARAIENLNRDPNARPAVIGVDILFTGEKAADPEGDRLLAAAAARFNNVVVASEADVDDELADPNDPYAPWDQDWAWIPPYPGLADAADTGHINAPNEDDGIVRHDLLYVNTVERGRLYSFARVIYEKWCRARNVEPKSPPSTAGNGLYYLPFTAKSYSVGKNFWDLLEGDIDPEIYRDKIVLIGPYAPGLLDSMPTALDRSDVMYGVDIHANALDAFHKGFFPREVERAPQLVLLFIVSFVAEFLFRNGQMRLITVGWLIVTIGWIVLCHVCYRYELLMHVIWIPLAGTMIFVGAVSTNYIRARNDRDRVALTFGRYVDPTIMDQLINGDPKSLDVGGKLSNIAVLFVDIRGFTSMSEQLPPATVVEILNRYLTLTTECIRRHHGTLDKFVGDCTMAFWNAPLEQDRPVHRACRAALDMIEGSKRLQDELRAEYGREISFGVGVHWGSAVVGNIGTEFRMDYTAIGDTVNTAARLEANAAGGTVLISRAVADMLGADADVTSLGNSIKLKGKSADFEILKLNSLREG